VSHLSETPVNETTLREEEVEKLWKAFKVIDADGNDAISAKELRQVMRSLGHNPTDIKLRDMFKEVNVDLTDTISFEEFTALLLAKPRNHQHSLKLAFSIFDKNNSGQITADEMRSVMSKFGLMDEELDEMLKEVDSDGDGSINFEEFCCLMPDEYESKTVYKDSIFSFNTSRLSTANMASTTQPTPQQAAADTASKVAELRELLVPHSQPCSQKGRGTSRLQMQIGLFRLLQGAAYRCFRESFSANCTTHLRVKNLPYRITDFVQFVQKVIELYKQLDVVEQACYPLLDAVVESITQEYARLQERIKNWKTLEKTAAMLAEEKATLEARCRSANVKEKFAAGIEFVLTMQNNLSLGDLVEGVLAISELNKLRGMELHEEMAPPPEKPQEDSYEYLQKWNRVILSHASEEVDGAMIPVAYWYEDFMPKLLAASSVSTKADIQSNTVPDEAALNKWYESAKKWGEFDRYGSDVVEGFLNCTSKQKLMLKQAWRLTRHYLNGVQKRRERLEAGRQSGALSQYVAFIDVYVGRTDVKNEQMRVSFPYYIGPAVWRFLHSTAEIICTKTCEQQTALISVFKDFFKLFAALYPCPYCRHHLNTHVVQNREADMYPVEYLMLGRDGHKSVFEVSLDNKLSTVVDGSCLRLFLWKLHNAVSSSIARSEEWYQKDEKAFYTTRYWPRLESELARVKALKHTSIATDFIYRIYDMLKPVEQLAEVKTTLPKLLGTGDQDKIDETFTALQNHIKYLEAAVIRGQFLQEIYHFDPNLVDEAPHFTPEEEEFARSGIFMEAL